MSAAPAFRDGRVRAWRRGRSRVGADATTGQEPTMNRSWSGWLLLACLGSPLASAQTIFRSGFEPGEGPLPRFTLAMNASVANANANGVTGDAGDSITLTFSASNTGEVALNDISVAVDRLPGLTCAIATLSVGATAGCAAQNNVYTITAGDAATGNVVFAATASAPPVGGSPVPAALDSDAIALSASPPSAKSGLGTNLEGVEDFSVAYPFTDFFKQSRPWITSSQTVFDTDDADLLDLDADGWVESLPACTADPQQFCRARTVINASEADWPNGNYLVRFDGNGTITYGGVTRIDDGSIAGRHVVQVNTDSLWFLTIESTSPPPNHVRNIRIFPPGFDPAVAPVPTFHPDFLAKLAPYRSIRFMDWMKTNGGGFGGAPNPQVEFSDRALPTDAHWTREAGVPLEVMIELSNLLDAEPWFTIPHQASDAYVTAFAQRVRDTYEPGRVIYVEHSNEVWNNFPQRFDVEADALANFTGPESDFTKRMNQHGLRTRQICDIFRDVFGPRAPWIECTLGSQAANAFTAEEAADCPLAVARGLVTGGACLQAGDSLAIAPYFGNYLDGPSNADEVQLWNLNELFAEINDGGQLDDDMNNSNTPCTDNFPQVTTLPCPISALEEVVPWIRANATAANARQLSLVSYEGGQHLVGILGVENIQAVTDLFIAANRDPRMGTAYTQYLTSWKDNGGELFMHFNLTFGYGRFGSWGALESLTQTPAPPKHQAIVNFAQNNPCWWPGCDGNTPPPPPPPPPPAVDCGTQLLSDPGLEATSFSNPNEPTNPGWASTSTNFGSVLCRVGICPDDGGTAVPRNGQVWAWFGGIAASETSTLRQNVVLPAGQTRHLNFFLRRSFVAAPLDAVLRVKIDGQTLRTFDEPAAPEGSYIGRTVDLSAFGDGLNHQLQFEYVNPSGSGKSNFLLDDLTVECTASGS